MKINTNTVSNKRKNTLTKSQLRLNSAFFFHIFLIQCRGIFSHDLGLFDVRTDLLSVEKLTFDYLKNADNWLNPFKFLITRSKPVQSVCNLPHESKVTLCWSFLKSEEYKFDITLKVNNDSPDIECEPRKLSLRILDQGPLNRNQLLMFRCPQIAEDVFLKEAPFFYVSDSGWDSVAIIFKQKNSRAALYPYKYLRKIDFDELNSTLPFSLKKSLWYGEVGNKQLISTSSTDHKFSIFRRLIDATEISDPYAKFQAFFRATDVCGLDLSQKIYLCREILTDFELEGEDLFVDEYSDGRCVRIIADSFDTKKVSAFQCPPVMVYDRNDESSDAWETMYSTSLHFLAKTVFPARFLAIEPSNRRWKIRFQAAVINLQFLQKVRQIERDSLYPQQGAQESSSMSTTTYRGREKSYPFAFPVEMNRKIAEDSVVELARIRNISSPYEKFHVTFSIQNVCHLRLDQKLELCRKIFENQAFGYEIAEVNELKCNKKWVFLIATRITVPLRDFTLMAFSCSLTQPWPPFKLHVSGSPETNSVLVLDQSFDENEVTARTIVRGHPSNKLSNQESLNQFYFLRRQ